jgi:hypothetical protein
VRVDHLFLGTQKDNVCDMVQKGRAAPPDATKHLGSKNGRALISEHHVRIIRCLLSLGVRQKDMAPAFGVGPHVIWNIANGNTWSHVQ